LTAAATGYQAATGAVVLTPFVAAATGYDQPIWTFAGAAKVPGLSSSILSGEVITIEALAVRPLLSAYLFNEAVIAAALTAARPRLLASLLNGTVGSAALVAVTPTVVASGYPAYIITFAGAAPSPQLIANLISAVAENYRTWVLNTRKGALTEYGSWQFNSFATFNGQVLAAGPSGIVVLGAQDKDNTTAITARVRTGKDSFKSSFHKRVPRIYLGYESTGDLLVRTITTEGGERTYLLPWNNITGVQQRRAPVGKGPRSRYWQFEVENKDGADFAVDNLLVHPVTLRRRVQ